VFVPWLLVGPFFGIFIVLFLMWAGLGEGAVSAVGVGPDGKVLALSRGCDVYLLDIATGRELWSRLSTNRAFDWGDSSEARSAKSKILFLDAPMSSGEATLAEAYGSNIVLRSLHSGQVLRRVGGRGDLTATVSFDGRLAASGGSMQSHGAFSGSTQSYDLSLVDTTSRQERSLQGHQKAVRCLTFRPNGSLLASGSADQTIRLWDTATAAEQACLSGHGGAVTGLAFSPDGSLLASGSEDLTVRLWDVAAGAERTKLEGHTGPVTSVAFSPDGRWLASASADTTVRLWEVSTGRELLCLEGHSAKVNALAFSPDGAFLVSGGDDKTVRAWDASTGAQLWQLTAKRVGIYGVRFERS
jgi:WD40 repeat protein